MISEIEIAEVLGGGWMVLVAGVQWGPDPSQFDHQLGCSKETWPTREEAEAAIDAYIWVEELEEES